MTDLRNQPGFDPQPPAGVLVKHLGLVEVGSLQNDVALAVLVGTLGLDDGESFDPWFHPQLAVYGLRNLVLQTFPAFS